MNITGFCSNSQQLTVPRFIEENLVGFSQMRGLEASDVRFQILPDTEKLDIAVSANKDCSGPRVQVSLNDRLIRQIEVQPLRLKLYASWNLVGKCLRLSFVESGNIPDPLLVPTKALVLCGYDHVQEDLCTLYTAQNWSETHLRRQCDAAFVGLRVADTMTAEGIIPLKMSPIGIARMIFFMRRNNWESFLPVP